MKRAEFKHKRGSIKKQVVMQGLEPVVATVSTIFKKMSNPGLVYASITLNYRRSIDNPSSDTGASGAGSSRNEPMPTPVSSRTTNCFLMEENLSTAPVPAINPRFIEPITEEPPLEKLEDDGLQNAVVYQNSKLFEKTRGQWVAELLSE